MPEVPVIDVAALVDPSAPVDQVEGTADEIDAACRDVGFFSVVGHGIDSSHLDRLDDLAREFFAQPDEVKAGIAMEHAGRAWRGWFPVGGELTSGVPDLKEGLYFGAEHPPDHLRVRSGTPLHGANLFPDQPEQLRETVLHHLHVMTTLGQAILGGMAVALGLERSWFVDHLTADPVVLFRIFRYPPAATDASAPWGVAEHTDYGLLTMLAQDRSGGLQVRTRERWVDVDPIPNGFVCNIGDMLERVTGGTYRSTPHRVRNDTRADRLSFPFFLDPSWDAVVERLPIVERPAHDPAGIERWDHANVHGFTGTYGEYLLAKVAKVFPDLAGGAARGR
jgi:isopenicillin N synthase-like dioxygenase